MKGIILLLILLALPLCLATVTISEVMVNPFGSENDNEYVVLFNDGPAVNISGWVIKTRSSDADATLPNVFLQTNAYFKIADDGFNGSANHYEDISLANDDGGVALLNGNEIIDSVGWGDALDFVESSAAIICDEGFSLLRQEDTNNNANDFTCGLPDLISEDSKSINVELEVVSLTPMILSVSIDDEAPEIPGLQVFPLPGEVKEKHVTIEVSHYSDYLVFIHFDGNKFEGKNFTFPYTQPSGLYNVTVEVCDSDCSTQNLEIVIEEVIAFDIDTTLVSLGSNMGGVYQLVGDLSLDTHLKPTIVNLGNTNIRFEVSSEGLTFNGSLIPSENIGCAISSSAPNEYFSLPYISSLIITGESRMMSLEFAVPSTTPGLYRGEIQVKAVK